MNGKNDKERAYVDNVYLLIVRHSDFKPTYDESSSHSSETGYENGFDHGWLHTWAAICGSKKKV